LIFSDTQIIMSDTRLIAGDGASVTSDILLVHSDTKLIVTENVRTGSDVRLVDASVKVSSSDVRLVDASVKVASSDTRLVHSDTKLITTESAFTRSDLRLLVQEVRPISGTELAKAVGAGAAALVTVISDFRNASVLSVEVNNSDVTALDAFVVSVRAHSDAAYQIIANATSDFVEAIQWPILGCGADLTTLAIDGNATFQMAIDGLFSVKLDASGNLSTTALDVRWQAR